ncbi:MAG: Mur ligase, partial [Planctomycetota bacterium]
MKLRGSRRLTGPNLLWEHPGALIQVGVASGDLRHAIEAWRRGAGEILEAVGWGDERTAVRRFHGGAD